MMRACSARLKACSFKASFAAVSGGKLPPPLPARRRRYDF